jgi:zinc resistance-associated protein
MWGYKMPIFGIGIALYTNSLKKKFQEVNMKRWYVTMFVVLLAALATTVFAFGPRGGHGAFGSAGPCFGGPMGPEANLNLSKEQADKMWQIKEKFHNDTQALRHELFQKKFELRTLYADPKAEEATILAKQKELNSLHQKMFDKMSQFKIEQRRILTPEQIKTLNETSGGRGSGPCGFGERGFGPGTF